MFESLTSSLNKVFKNLRGYGRLSEKNVKDGLREVRTALLEADVSFKVAKDFTARVREKCLGRDVLDSVTPGQQFIKHVHEELVELLGGARRDFQLAGKPAVVLLLGLHGAGKTTTCGKLALRWKGEGKRVLLVGADIRRPAAVDQLRILAEGAGAEFLGPEPGETVPHLGRRALTRAGALASDVVVFDTGGRFQIDEDLVGELAALRDAVRPGDTVLVIDAAIGQESVNVASRFHEALGLTGLILTKMDGDARGGAALSVHAVTGCPILLVGVGERAADLEPFHPDRMASRILGMGDVVTLVEKAQSAFDTEQVARMEQQLRKKTFDLEDFRSQLQQMKKLGPMENLLEMMPGASDIPAPVRDEMMGQSAQGMKKAEAILSSMTPGERRHPDILNASRRRRIARGSGMEVRDVNELLKNFRQAQKMTRRLKKMQKKLPGLGR